MFGFDVIEKNPSLVFPSVEDYQSLMEAKH
jgi:hypothetical protein